MNKEINNADSQTTSDPNLVTAVAISVILTAIIVGFGVYNWQQRIYQEQIALLESRLNGTPIPSPIVTFAPTSSPVPTPTNKPLGEPGDTWIQPSLPSGYPEDTVRILDTVKVGDVIEGMKVSKIEASLKDNNLKLITFSGEKVLSATCVSHPANPEGPYNPNAHVSCVNAPIPFATLEWNSANRGQLIFSNDQIARDMFSPMTSKWNATIRIRGLEVAYPAIEGISAKTKLLEVINKTLDTK